MAGKDAVDDDDGLPSYDDATAEPLGRVLSGPGLVSEVEYQRQELVRTALESHVMPVLRRQAKFGLAKSVTILEPYDPRAVGFEKTGHSKAGDVVSPMDQDLTLVQLEGDQNSVEFWRQPSVCQEMEQQLRVILSASTVFRDVTFELPPRPEAVRAESSSSRRGWGKKLGSKSEVPMAHPAKNSNGLELSVTYEGIIRRIENDFGLYENTTKPGLVIRVVVEGR